LRSSLRTLIAIETLQIAKCEPAGRKKFRSLRWVTVDRVQSRLKPAINKIQLAEIRIMPDGVRILPDGVRILLDGFRILLDSVRILLDRVRILLDGVRIPPDVRGVSRRKEP